MIFRAKLSDNVWQAHRMFLVSLHTQTAWGGYQLRDCDTAIDWKIDRWTKKITRGSHRKA